MSTLSNGRHIGNLDESGTRRMTVKSLTIVVLTSLVVGLAGCSAVQPVTSRHSTNIEGSPGSAGDLTTGGQGTSAHGDIVQ